MGQHCCTIPIRKSLFAGIPANNNLFAGTLPANKNLIAGTLPQIKTYLSEPLKLAQSIFLTPEMDCMAKKMTAHNVSFSVKGILNYFPGPL